MLKHLLDLSLKLISDSKEFKACSERFSQWTSLIKEACKDMLSDLKSFESHEYVAKDDKIGYKEQDNIVFDTSYGYKTLFAYFLENEKGTISRDSLNKNISILIRLGSFSYAEVPLKFHSILGVTGTLETLSTPEKNIIENVYNIKFKTFIPSCYGRNNLIFSPKENVLVESEQNHYRIIVQEISHKILGKNPGTKRAVFIVMESNKELQKFLNSDAFLPYKNEAAIHTEEASLQEKNFIISNATISGKVTIFTKIFGRGTDFKIYDEIVTANGGIHVIQTFLSEALSEEVQIKGRTARQGEDGSYSMILSIKDLEKYLIKPEHMEVNADNKYAFLNEKRNTFFNLQYAENTKYVEAIKGKHDLTTHFIENIFKGDMNSVKEFIINENKGAETESQSKTLILMDATGSMGLLLDQTKKTLEVMFQRVSDVLKENNFSANSFQIKIAVFRNYNSSIDMILEVIF